MIILASNSPRRKKLLKEILNDFVVEAREIDETLSYNLPPEEAVKDISKRKALEEYKYHLNAAVIGADTIVVFEGKIIGKPVDEMDARRILHLLSNKTHTVMTAYTIIKNYEYITRVVKTEVTFNELSEYLITDYILNKKPLDKAGAYGIQDRDEYPLVKEYTGELENIIGLPIKELKEDLIKFKVIFPDD